MIVRYHNKCMQLSLLDAHFALVVEIVPYEQGSNSHAHFLVGPLHASIPSVSAKSLGIVFKENIASIMIFSSLTDP